MNFWFELINLKITGSGQVRVKPEVEKSSSGQDQVRPEPDLKISGLCISGSGQVK